MSTKQKVAIFVLKSECGFYAEVRNFEGSDLGGVLFNTCYHKSQVDAQVDGWLAADKQGFDSQLMGKR